MHLGQPLFHEHLPVRHPNGAVLVFAAVSFFVAALIESFGALIGV
jgi:hypothetical protein